MIKAVLFDLDNTLVDFMRMKNKAAEAALDAMIGAGLRMKRERALGLLFRLYWKSGIENQRIFQMFLRSVTGKIDYRVLAAGIHAYRKEKERQMVTYPAVKRILKKLKRKYKLGIISDAPSIQVWLRLTELGLAGYFDIIITPVVTKAHKPSGLPFKLALRKLGMKPENVAMVGDWPSRDIIPAQKIGLVAILARYGQNEIQKERCDPDYIINDFKELPAVLNNSGHNSMARKITNQRFR